MTYTIRRSKLSLCIGYFLAEGALISILMAMLIIWRDEPAYLDWPMAILSWTVVAVFFHCLLFTGTFYSVRVNGEMIEYHAFLRKTKKLSFSDIQKITQSIGMDVKIVGHNHKALFYVKLTDRNYHRFMDDVSAHIEKRNTV
ncbi:hypothetical protein LJC63_01110 [Ruminococcaceae bacterium OttesenSCG-928-L11]|nr:hypothetical protein [Ruminococcaceae bacterium OttesenSCG-928-L11]